MNFGFIVSAILIGLAIVGVFIQIPIVSDFAFWLAIAAYLFLASSRI
jgi:hypothetical protein